MPSSNHARIAAPLLAVFAVLLVAACSSGSSGSHTAQPSASSASSSAGGGSGSGAGDGAGAAAAPSADSVIALHCDTSQWTLTVVPAGGGSPTTRRFELPSGATPTFTCNDPSFALREDFDREFARLAVTVTESAGPAGQSGHVGYVREGSGANTYVDLDAAASSAQNAAPVFNDSTDEFWYVDASGSQSVLRSRDLSADAVRTVGEAPKASDPRFTLLGATGRVMPYIAPDGLSTPARANPSGTVLAKFDSTGGDGLSASLDLLDAADPNAGTENVSTQLLRLQGSQLPRSNMTPLTWIDDHTLITSADVPASANNTGANAFFRFDFTADDRRLLRTTKLLIDSDNLNVDPVASPDRTHIAFLSQVNGQISLYVGDATRLATLRTLTIPDPAPTALLAWT